MNFLYCPYCKTANRFWAIFDDLMCGRCRRTTKHNLWTKVVEFPYNTIVCHYCHGGPTTQVSLHDVTSNTLKTRHVCRRCHREDGNYEGALDYIWDCKLTCEEGPAIYNDGYYWSNIFENMLVEEVSISESQRIDNIVRLLT